MSMYKSGLDMLRCALRSTSLWTSDSFRWTQMSLCYISRSFAVSSQLGRKHIQGHTLKQVRYYSQGGHDVLNVPIKQTETSEPLNKAERIPIYSHLENCFCPTDVLDTLKQYPASQDLISNIFTRMWVSTKKLTEEQRSCELRLMYEHPGFQEVCERAAIEAWRMKSDDLAYTLLAIVNLGVSQNTHVVQVLLRVIQERLNEFEIKALSVLAGCIRDMEDCRNVQALKDALRLLLKDRIPEIQSVVVLQSMMRAVGQNSPTHLKKQLAIKTLSLADEFNPPNSQYMFSSLASMGLNFKPLLDICSKNIAENVHEFPFGRLLSVLKSCHELRYRNHALFNSVSEYMANTLEMWTNKQVILILVSFEELLFRPVVLLDVFAERIIENPDSLTLRDVLSVLKVYSLLNHDLKEKKTEFLASITKVLESYLPKMTPNDLLKAVYCLALLEHVPQTLLDKLLQRETMHQIIKKGNQSNKVQRWLHMLGLCMRLDEHQLPHSLRSIPDFHFTVPAHKVPVNQEMLSAIKSIVGNDAVQDSVLEESFYFIDFVITLPRPKQETCDLKAEDSGSPECPQRIAVICAPPTSFCFGTTHPRASLVVKLRHLGKLGYKPVLVPVLELNSKTEQEKIQMLQKLIFPEQESSGTQEILNNSPKAE
ncbi:FAST kinase domain-containing protein 2, mitochondrial [Pimephales promelas]|uniref:FAST kinase domain-containing protein 2, mitochondrial n=1 Tax=Pimephales promelas TaxID=90988 RepID=UPI0019558059|nr:FAST kinase domain-containing protein 2, mitochondrial [Pimephales promelas]